MDFTAEQLKILLTGTNLISPDAFDAANEKAKQKGLSLLEYLPKSGIISDNQLGQLLASSLRVNFTDLSKEKVTKENLSLLPEAVARAQQAIVFKLDESVHVATTHPDSFEFIKMIERKFGKPAIVYLATTIAMHEALRQYDRSYDERIGKILKDLNSRVNDEGIVALVSLILEYAHASHASDIHIEPLDHDVIVRFRIDGVLHEVLHFPALIKEKIVFRLKIMSRLRTDEHAAPQDGRFSFKSDTTKEGETGDMFDVRVSILPITNGENVVMRILAEQTERYSLVDLGLSQADLEKVERASRKPYGMILSVGPTGAGKTTTLYAILQLLNHPEVNIMTIEDPVEYAMDHVQQTQVNEKKKLNFATGLRSIVRQDPDIIMVGEIRDEETAAMAVNASMTGHLVLSTLHTNDAATTFPRLYDMGVEPFLIGSSVNVVIAQRLTRKICSKCKSNYFLGEHELSLINADPTILAAVKRISGKKDITKVRFYRGDNPTCETCGGSGYNGRVGIFEVLEVSEKSRSLIAQKATSADITEMAHKEGMQTMLEDGIAKMLQGLTTFEEVIRATKS